MPQGADKIRVKIRLFIEAGGGSRMSRVDTAAVAAEDRA